MIFTPEILLFILLQIINVILSTIKSIILIKGYKWASILANTIYFGVYTAVLKQLTMIDNIWSLIIITMLANFFGWTIATVVKKEYLKDYKKALNDAKIKYISYQTTWDECAAIDIFSENRSQSKVIKDILIKFKAKYSIQTSHRDL